MTGCKISGEISVSGDDRISNIAVLMPNPFPVFPIFQNGAHRALQMRPKWFGYGVDFRISGSLVEETMKLYVNAHHG